MQDKNPKYSLSYSKLNALECEYGYYKTYVETNSDKSITYTDSNTIGTAVHNALTQLTLDEDGSLKFIPGNYTEDTIELVNKVLNAPYSKNNSFLVTDYSDHIVVDKLDMVLAVKPDLVLIGNDSVKIIEFKTFTVKFAMYVQLYVYLYGILNSNEDKYQVIRDAITEKGTIELIYHFLSEDRIRSETIYQEDIPAIINMMENKFLSAIYTMNKVEGAVESNRVNNLTINKKSAFCHYCCVRGICPASTGIGEFINSNTTDLTIKENYMNLSKSEKLAVLNDLRERSEYYKKQLNNCLDQIDNEFNHIISTMTPAEIRNEKNLVFESKKKIVIDKYKAVNTLKNMDLSKEQVNRIIESTTFSRGLMKDLNIDDKNLLKTFYNEGYVYRRNKNEAIDEVEEIHVEETNDDN